MNENTLFIMYSPFSLESSLYIVSEDGKNRKRINTSSKIAELAEAAVYSAHEQGIMSIRISAPLAVYDEMKNVMQAFEQAQYSTSNLKIEVI